MGRRTLGSTAMGALSVAVMLVRQDIRAGDHAGLLDRDILRRAPLDLGARDPADRGCLRHGRRGQHGRPEGCCRERSEEHTSELQSRQYLVCRLLLEKKKKYSLINSTSTLLTLILSAYIFFCLPPILRLIF